MFQWFFKENNLHWLASNCGKLEDSHNAKIYKISKVEYLLQYLLIETNFYIRPLSFVFVKI